MFLLHLLFSRPLDLLWHVFILCKGFLLQNVWMKGISIQFVSLAIMLESSPISTLCVHIIKLFEGKPKAESRQGKTKEQHTQDNWSMRISKTTTKKEMGVLVHGTQANLVRRILAPELVPPRTFRVSNYRMIQTTKLAVDHSFVRKPARCGPESQLKWPGEVLRPNHKTGEEHIVTNQGPDKSSCCWDVLDQTNKGLSEICVRCITHEKIEKEIPPPLRGLKETNTTVVHNTKDDRNQCEVWKLSNRHCDGNGIVIQHARCSMLIEDVAHRFHYGNRHCHGYHAHDCQGKENRGQNTIHLILIKDVRVPLKSQRH
mmetsp:Transcript_34234/g.71265  ORF Transcript_34234/g.71265 Transcript_34234/m.71265 type:complete len:315 (+) Transcript_34234:127-1071(+)